MLLIANCTVRCSSHVVDVSVAYQATGAWVVPIAPDAYYRGPGNVLASSGLCDSSPSERMVAMTAYRSG